MRQEQWGRMYLSYIYISLPRGSIYQSQNVQYIEHRGTWTGVMSFTIQKNWCTVAVAPTVKHHVGLSRTPANQRWDQVPGRRQCLLLGYPHPPWIPSTQRNCIYGGLTLDMDRHYIGSVTATTHQEKKHNNTWVMTRYCCSTTDSKKKNNTQIGFLQ